MARFSVDDTFHGHPKAREVGLEAIGLWAVSGSNSMCYKLDGIVPDWFVSSWPRGRILARKLVSAGLWITVDDGDVKGWRFHDWDDYQPLSEEIERQREMSRERSRRRRAKKPASVTRDVTRDDHHDVTRDERRTNGENSLPVPFRSVPSTTSSSEVAPRPDVASLCETLAGLVEANGAKRPSISQRWLTEARLLLDADKRPRDEAERVMRWALGDSFWRTNILSMPKFRAKYDQLLLKSGQANVRDESWPRMNVIRGGVTYDPDGNRVDDAS